MSIDRFILALTATGMAALSAGALWVSYWHAHAFVSVHGAHGVSGYIVAATVDGLILMSVTAIAMAKRAGQDVPLVARASLVVGLAGTGVAKLRGARRRPTTENGPGLSWDVPPTAGDRDR